MSIATLLGGVISDKFGRRFATLGGLYIFIIGNTGCFFSKNVTFLNIARIIQAIGGGMSTILSTTVARDVFEQNETLQILSVIGSIRPAAIAGAPMLGGIISNYFGGWRSVYLFTAIVSVLVLILSF